MKTKNIIKVLLCILLVSCVENKKPFKPALEQVLLDAIDTFKDEISQKKLLSIGFYNPDEYNRKCVMKIFISNNYSSARVDGYAKLGKTTIALYNLKDDLYETVNKNEIVFFTDTLKGFRDSFDIKKLERCFFYSIYNEGNIKRISFVGDFKCLKQIRGYRGQKGMKFTFPPDNLIYFFDSIKAEADLEYFKKKVNYYRNKSKVKSNLR
jgi:hypothetical protein